MVLLGLAVRFIHFALFSGTLLSPYYFSVDFVVLTVLAGLGFRITRVRQMVAQYSWIYRRSGIMSWRSREDRLQ